MCTVVRNRERGKERARESGRERERDETERSEKERERERERENASHATLAADRRSCKRAETAKRQKDWSNILRQESRDSKPVEDLINILSLRPTQTILVAVAPTVTQPRDLVVRALLHPQLDGQRRVKNSAASLVSRSLGFVS